MQNNLTDWLTFEIWTNEQFNQHTQKKLNTKQFKQEYKTIKKININTFNN